MQALVAGASARPRTGRIAAAIGVVTLLASATGVLIQLQDTLNTVWEVTPKPGFFLKTLFKKRLLCFLLILGAGALLLFSLAASAGLAALQHVLEARLEIGLSTLLGGADVVLSWLVMALLLAMVYRLLPDVEIGWRDVAWGSAMTAILFTLGKYAIGFYLQRTGVTTAYGAAGSLVLVLVWIYLSSMIFLLGAEFTRVHSRRYRDGKAPATPGAVRVETIQVPVETAPPSSPVPLPLRRDDELQIFRHPRPGPRGLPRLRPSSSRRQGQGGGRRRPAGAPAQHPLGPQPGARERRQADRGAHPQPPRPGPRRDRRGAPALRLLQAAGALGAAPGGEHLDRPLRRRRRPGDQDRQRRPADHRRRRQRCPLPRAREPTSRSSRGTMLTTRTTSRGRSR